MSRYGTHFVNLIDARPVAIYGVHGITPAQNSEEISEGGFLADRPVSYPPSEKDFAALNRSGASGGSHK
jgi:hypothetical protein